MTAQSPGLALARPTVAQQRIARIAGVFFIITFVASIPALLLYEPLLKHHNYILGAGTDTRIAFGALLEIITAIANIATAVVLYPILKRQSQSISLGYVASRTLESTVIVIVIGIVSVLSVVTLRQDVGGAGAADGASLVLAGRSLVAIHDWTFLLGPAFCARLRNRTVARLPDVQVRPRATAHGNAGSHRRAPDLCFGDRNPVRRLQERLRAGDHRGPAGNRLGAVAWHLPHRQRVQAFSHPRSRIVPEYGSVAQRRSRAATG